MDDFFSWDEDDDKKPKRRPYSPPKPRNNLLERLKLAKEKLAPIISKVKSSENRLGRSRSRIKHEQNSCAITKDQYKEVLFASELLQNIDFSLKNRDSFGDIQLPNTDVIVANVDLEYEATKLGKSKTIVLDGGVLGEIVDLYKQLGEAIGRLIIEANSNTEQTRLAASFENVAKSSTIAMPDSQAAIQQHSVPEVKPSKTEEAKAKAITSKTSKVSAKSSSGGKLGDSLSRMISQNKVRDESETRDKGSPESDPNLEDSAKTSTKVAESSEHQTDAILKNSSNVMSKGSSKSSTRSKSATEQKSQISGSQLSTTRSKSVPKTNSIKMPTKEVESKSDELFVSKSPSKTKSRNVHIDDHKEDGVIYITIKCFSDLDDTGNESDYTCIPICETSCPSGTDAGSTHVHVKVDGRPITVKINQEMPNNDGLYCLNAGNDDEDNIKIMLKKCPECCSAVLASSAKIESVHEIKPDKPSAERDLGDSHESVTLHGKALDEGNENALDVFSDDDVNITDKPAKKPSDHEDSGSDSKKMNVLLDPDQLNRSIIQFDEEKDQIEQKENGKAQTGDEKESSLIQLKGKNSKGSKSSVKQDSSKSLPMTKSSEKMIPSNSKNNGIAAKQSIPLTRGKICSSLEFDVSVVETRLRSKGIEHPNAGIVVNLKELGVNQLLRACRPAKCCRKAILDEKNRTALPYAVSLQSLPLVRPDIAVIEQSIDMSVRKIKNSINLTQDYKNKMAYYVSLGRNDFRSNINFPWVLPSYDINCVAINSDSTAIEEAKSRYYLLRKIPSDYDDKFYVLKKIQEKVERTNKRFFHPYRIESVRKKSRSIRNYQQFGPKICQHQSELGRMVDLMDCGDGAFHTNMKFEIDFQKSKDEQMMLENIDLDFVLGRKNYLTRNEQDFLKVFTKTSFSKTASTSTSTTSLRKFGFFENSDFLYSMFKPYDTNFIVGMFTYDSRRPVPPDNPDSMHIAETQSIQLEEWAPHLVSVTSLPKLKTAQKCKSCKKNACVGTNCRANRDRDVKDEIVAKPKRQDSVHQKKEGCMNPCDRKIRIEIERWKRDKNSGTGADPSARGQCPKDICHSKALKYDGRTGRTVGCPKEVCEVYAAKSQKRGKNMESRFTLSNEDSFEILIDKSCVKVQRRDRTKDGTKTQRKE